MISASKSAHRPTRRAISLVLRFAAGVDVEALLIPATPSNMVMMAAMKVPTMTYANQCVNMRARVRGLGERRKGCPQ